MSVRGCCARRASITPWPRTTWRRSRRVEPANAAAGVFPTSVRFRPARHLVGRDLAVLVLVRRVELLGVVVEIFLLGNHAVLVRVDLVEQRVGLALVLGGHLVGRDLAVLVLV